ncbi:hypothetical protein [Deinococcus hopiensis]|uniref:hypothetical protein n=1 Tax=Deinococcus hopiensis TaxID=309885 RepID=UPI00111C290A|nr:hypothetical protein [Deinococcus hopiensis]
MNKFALMSLALLTVSCGQPAPPLPLAGPFQTTLHALTDSNTPGTGQSWTGGSFTDDFAFWGFNDALWERSGNNNGSPFGCAFNVNNAFPDVRAQSSGKLNLRLDTGGSRCAEMRTRAQQAAPRATIGGASIRTTLRAPPLPSSPSSVGTRAAERGRRSTSSTCPPGRARGVSPGSTPP